MLRDLQIRSQWRADGRVASSAPVVPGALDAGGTLRVGVIATLIDAAGAALALAEIAPDRVATVELAYCSTRPARAGEVVAVAAPLRSGSRQVVTTVDVFEGADEGADARIGTGTMTFSRLVARAGHAALPPMTHPDRRADLTPRSMAVEGSGLSRSLLEHAGVRVLDADKGVLEVPNHAWVRNSFGTLNGGVAATVLELAGEQAGCAATGARLQVADLSVHYVAQLGAEGRARTAARVLRVAADHAVCRVELRDADDGRLLSLGTVTAVRWGA